VAHATHCLVSSRESVPLGGLRPPSDPPHCSNLLLLEPSRFSLVNAYISKQCNFKNAALDRLNAMPQLPEEKLMKQSTHLFSFFGQT
jgi:hypothetical protein